MARTDIQARLGLDTTAFQRGMARADKGVKAFAKSAMSSFAAVAGVAGLNTMAMAATNLANEITNLSKIAGVSGVELQKISYAAEQFGISQEKTADILKDVNDKVGDFLATGAGPMADFFENIAPKVGVTADQFKELSSKDALQLYISSLEKANISQSEMTFYMEALASDATALLPLFSENGKALARLSEEADKYGLVMDDLTREKLKKANQTLERFQRMVTIISGEILTKVIPAFKILGDGLGFVGEVFAVNLLNMRNFFTFLGSSIVDVVQPAIISFKALGKGIEAAMLAAQRDFKGAKNAIEEATDLGKQAFDELKNAPSDIAENFKTMSEDIGRDVKSLGDDLERRAGSIKDNWNDAFGEVKNVADEATKATSKAAPAAATKPAATTSEKKRAIVAAMAPTAAAKSGRSVSDAMAAAKAQGIRFERSVGVGGEEYMQRFINGRKAGKFTQAQLEAAAAGGVPTAGEKLGEAAAEPKTQTDILQSIDGRLEALDNALR